MGVRREGGVLCLVDSLSLGFSLQMPTDEPEDRLNNEEKVAKVGCSWGGSSNIQRSISGSGVRKSDGMTFDGLFCGGWGCIASASVCQAGGVAGRGGPALISVND